MYCSNMATGHVSLPVLAIKTSSPFLSWSVLLCGIDSFMALSSMTMSQGLMLMSSLNRKKPANANKHAVASLKSDRDALSLASFTILLSTSIVTGVFLVVGLARHLWKASTVDLTNVEEVGDGSPAVQCTQAKALWASSTADLDLVESVKCWKYVQSDLVVHSW